VKKSRTLELDNKDSIRDMPANGPDVSKKPKFIVPPGLRFHIPLFEAHYDAAGKMPIMVVGATGVGKSLFLHLFKKLFKEKNKSSKVVEVNCANLGGGDRTLARAELFGYKKGAFTDAKEDTPGLIDEANGGALSLDEIGELPRDTQAMLLTFIETGKFRRVGDPKERSASVTIIGATNNQEKLNEPFRERFYIFPVPPLHQRRIDVPYYLCWLHPETFHELLHWEALALLAHNWPANVREIDKIGRFLKRKAAYYRILSSGSTDPNAKEIETKMMGLDKSETSFDPNAIAFLYEDLKKNGIDVKTLEKILNSAGVGLVSKNIAIPKRSVFEVDTSSDVESGTMVREYELERIKRFDISLISCKEFDWMFLGYIGFCSLFFQDPVANQNNILVDQCRSTNVRGPDGLFPSEHLASKFKELQGPIFRYLSGIQVPSSREIPNDRESREAFCLDLLRDHPSNPFLAPLKERYRIEEKEERVDIWSMKYDEFLRYYYEGLIERTAGNKRGAAKRIGVNYQTFNSRYRSLFKEGRNSKKQAEHQSSRRGRRVHP
jgi:DNA-binding NtrC family response regulator